MSYRDTPISDVNNLDPSLYECNQRQLGINSVSNLRSLCSVSLDVIYGFGRRISKTVDGSTTYFIYDGDQVIEERGAGGLVSYAYGTGIDEVLTMQRDGETYYYFYDGLGSVSDITDSSGNVVESYQYDVYGQPNQTSSIGNPYLFTGRRYDEETGLYHYRNRTYSPQIGRFLQRDPITWGPDDRRILTKSTNLSEIIFSILGINSTSNVQKKNIEQDLLLSNQFKLSPQYFVSSEGGLNLDTEVIKAVILGLGRFTPQLFNLYSYTRNNPVNYIDPDGEFEPFTLFWYIAVVTIVANHLYWAIKGGEKPPTPGPPQQPYQPMNPISQGPTGNAPCGK